MNITTKPGSRQFPMQLFCMVVLFLLFSSLSVAAKTATFLMMSGKEYANVSYRVQTQFKTVEITTDNGKVNLSYADIAAIYDSDGKDITHATIKRDTRVPKITDTAKATEAPPLESKPDSAASQAPTSPDSSAGTQPAQPKPAVQSNTAFQETWDSKSDDIFKNGNKSSWAVLFSGGATYTVPSGDYYTGVNGGIGFEVNLLIPVTREIGIHFLMGKAGLSPDKDELRSALGASDWPVVQDNLSVGSWKFLLMGSYLIEQNRQKTLSYVSTGLGITSHSSSGMLLFDDPGSDQYLGIKFNNKTFFTIPVRAGINIFLGKTLALDLGGGADLLFMSGTNSAGDSALKQVVEFNIKAGLTLGLLRKTNSEK